MQFNEQHGLKHHFSLVLRYFDSSKRIMECDHKADRATFFVTDHTELCPCKTNHTIPQPQSAYNVILAISGPGKGRQNNVTLFSMCSTEKPKRMSVCSPANIYCKYMSKIWIRGFGGSGLGFCNYVTKHIFLMFAITPILQSYSPVINF